MRAICVLVILFLAPNSYAGLFTNGGPGENRRSRVSKSKTIRYAEEALLKGEYEEAFEKCEVYLDSRRPYDRICYLAAASLLKMRRYEDARRYLKMILEECPSSDLQNDAYVGIGDSYYLEGEYEDAIEIYDRALRYYPDKDNTSAVYYSMAQCYKRLKNGGKEREYREKVARLHPDSIEAALLGDLPGEEDATYTVQVGVFKNRDNAVRLSEELEGLGYKPRVTGMSKQGVRHYRVRVGYYDNRESVEEAALKLRDMGFPTRIYP